MTPLNPTSGVASGHAGGPPAGPKTNTTPQRNADLITALAAADQADNLLSLSDAGIAKLLQILASPPTPETAVQLAEFYRSAIQAAAAGDMPAALDHLAGFAALDPRRAATLPSDPALAAIRIEVTHLLTTLTFAAKAEAEMRLDQARQSLQAAGTETRPDVPVKPEVALQVAEQLIEAGGYANFRHSAELSQLVLNYPQGIPASIPAAPDISSRLPPRVFLWIAAALGALLLIVSYNSC